MFYVFACVYANVSAQVSLCACLAAKQHFGKASHIHEVSKTMGSPTHKGQVKLSAGNLICLMEMDKQLGVLLHFPTHLKITSHVCACAITCYILLLLGPIHVACNMEIQKGPESWPTRTRTQSQLKKRCSTALIECWSVLGDMCMHRLGWVSVCQGSVCTLSECVCSCMRFI